ncbi:MAG: hypothetical protein QOG67_2292, partial [Verrucomicrobiota bacterium]
NGWSKDKLNINIAQWSAECLHRQGMH